MWRYLPWVILGGIVGGAVGWWGVVYSARVIDDLSWRYERSRWCTK